MHDVFSRTTNDHIIHICENIADLCIILVYFNPI